MPISVSQGFCLRITRHQHNKYCFQVLILGDFTIGTTHGGTYAYRGSSPLQFAQDFEVPTKGVIFDIQCEQSSRKTFVQSLIVSEQCVTLMLYSFFE